MLFNQAEHTIDTFPLNLSAAVAQVALLQPYNNVTVQMVMPNTNSTVGIYDAARRDLAGVLFNQAEHTIDTAPLNLTAAVAQVALLQPYNNITVQMVTPMASTAGIYDAARRDLVYVLYNQAETTIHTSSPLKVV